MAGRGTDIKLGGNKDFVEDGKKIDVDEIKINETKVKNLGGLFIIGTERHESRRIDNQLRGRAGRRGDPGNTIFFISLQDELMRIFGADSIDGMLKKLGLKENESIDHPWINKAMERAQQKVEGRNFDIRKTLIKFDDVMNDQRQVIFGQRLKILKSKHVTETLESFLSEIVLSLDKIKDERLHYFGRRLIYEEKPEVLPKEEYNQIRATIAKRLLSTNNEKWNTISRTYSEIDTLREKFEREGKPENLAILDDINEYVEENEKFYNEI